jgi:regulator of replication initiation timing
MAKMGRGVDLEPIDRLEEKVKMLVSMIERLRSDQARATEENQRLMRDLESVRQRLADVEGAAAEMTLLREERDQIRSRVVDMLDQLEALKL